MRLWSSDYNDYHKELILILDFGSQYTQLIARKTRELGVYCEIYPFNLDMEKIMVDETERDHPVRRPEKRQ